MKTAIFSICMSLAALTPAFADDARKLTDDPTKVITKIGLRYLGTVKVSGSLAVGQKAKINASYGETGEWSLGGSYLFNFGIVNVAASNRELSGGTSQTTYSIGTFMPLSALGFALGGWQIFPTAGYSYSESSAPSPLELTIGDTLVAPVTSRSGYLGAMGLKPLGPKLTLKVGGVVLRGTNDYSGVSLGAGLTYMLTPKDSLTVFGSYIDNSFGSRDTAGIGYTREF